MDQYTPKVRTGGRRNHLTLSAKQYTKITGTIASVRRNRQVSGNELQEEDEYGLESGSRGHNEPSFIAEKSFVRAPLNSRVPSTSTNAKGKGKAKAESLDRVPVDIQEAMILEDLLFVLMGIEGSHITYPPDYVPDDDYSLHGVRFVTSPSLDPSLRDLVERILPLATYYTAISSFVELRSHLDYGLVNHALCAAIRDMLKDYQTLLSQLEYAYTSSPQFSLQKLWFYVHPTLHTLSLIYGLVTELALVDDLDPSDSQSSSEMSEDAEEVARNEALGLGGAALKAVLGEINGAGAGGDNGGGPVKGGEVLAVLHDRMQNMSGDPAASALYRTLIRAAGRPYASMLNVWMCTGRLDDPYEELCVKESRFIDRGTLEVDYTDEYWERRYTLRDGSTLSAKRHQAGVPSPRTPGGRLPGGACIPPLLQAWKHKVLLAGKYLNVIRECGIEITRGADASQTENGLAMDDEKFYKSIEDAYTFANRTLLNVLLKDQQLVPRLRTLKHYFFLSQSSFLTHFLDLSHAELRKSAKSASLVKLQSLLDLAMNVDGGGGAHGEGEDAYREAVRVTMSGNGLYEWLLKVVSVSGVIGAEEGEGGAADPANGHEESKKDKEDKDKDKKQMLAIDALTLDYTVKFPLSLVISRKTILRYQLLFRFLLHLRHVEQSLTAMWLDQKSYAWRTPVARLGHDAGAEGVGHPELELWRNRVFLLRARMLAFVQQMLAFTTFEVLEPNWRALEIKLAKVETVDQLLRDHVDFLDTCLKECMLTSSKLLRAFSRLIVTCSTFALYTSSFTKSANQALSALEASGGDPASAPMEKRWDFLSKFETNFNHWFKVHLDCVQFYASSENVSLLPLVVRLNSVRSTP